MLWGRGQVEKGRSQVEKGRSQIEKGQERARQRGGARWRRGGVMRRGGAGREGAGQVGRKELGGGRKIGALCLMAQFGIPETVVLPSLHPLGVTELTPLIMSPAPPPKVPLLRCSCGSLCPTPGPGLFPVPLLPAVVGPRLVSGASLSVTQTVERQLRAWFWGCVCPAPCGVSAPLHRAWQGRWTLDI